MVRSGKKARRLVVDGEIFLWSLSHAHSALGDGRYEDCRETLVIRRFEASGRVSIVFRQGPGRLVPDGCLMPSGAVGTTEGRFLNLHEPGTARALLDEALARGWQPGGPGVQELDGCTLFEAVATRRGEGPASVVAPAPG